MLKIPLSAGLLSTPDQQKILEDSRSSIGKDLSEGSSRIFMSRTDEDELLKGSARITSSKQSFIKSSKL
jgi:hypothetical protein